MFTDIINLCLIIAVPSLLVAHISLRWREIKRLFTKVYLSQVGPGESRNCSREKRGEAAIWQRRFWEHTIQDQEDFNRHVGYIHYNPVKHGLVESMKDWPWSSFHQYVSLGLEVDEPEKKIGKEIDQQLASII